VYARAQSSLPGGEVTLRAERAVTSHDGDDASLVAGDATPTSPAAARRLSARRSGAARRVTHDTRNI